MGKTFYYSDELRDDFAGTKIKQKPLPEDYEYIPKNPLRRGVAWGLHHLLVTPVAWIYLKIASGQKIVGRKKLRPYRKSGYFLYGNHTRTVGDAFTPSIVAFPKKPYIVVNPDAVSIRGCKRIVEDLGGMPLPGTWTLSKKFCAAMETRIQKGSPVVIYPEAHIWPLYTGIRPFGDASFSYPVSLNAPVFSFTVTYRKGWLRTRTTVYIDGPFFPDEALPRKERKEKLKEEVYGAMLERSKLSTYSRNLYVKREYPEPDLPGEPAEQNAE